MTVIQAGDRFGTPSFLLPEEFWAARPVLGHIRDAARRRLAPPDLTLGAVLARVAVLADHRLRIPPTIGYPSPLGLFVCSAASSSGGKTSSIQTGAALLPGDNPPNVELDASPASGEALLDMFWGEEPTEDGKGTVRARTVDAVLISLDEGSLLEKLDGRSGNTLLPFLLTGWSGATLGTDTLASVGRNGVKRRLAAGTYVLSLVAALQPKKAAHLLAQRDSGLAQRFTWLTDKDPGALEVQPESTAVVPLELYRPSPVELRGRDLPGGLLALGRSDAISRELWRAGWEKRQLDFEGDELDGHALLIRLRVAHCLALLDHRLDATDEDWLLAGMVSRVSASVRRGLLGTVAELAAAQDRVFVNREVLAAEAKELAREERFRSRCFAAVLAHVRGHGPVRTIPQNAISENHRPFVEAALVAHERNGLIRRDDAGLWVPVRGVEGVL